MNNRPTLIAGLLFSLLLIAVVLLALFDKEVPEYVSMPLVSIGTFLIGVITKYPTNEQGTK